MEDFVIEKREPPKCRVLSDLVSNFCLCGSNGGIVDDNVSRMFYPGQYTWFLLL